MALSHPGAPARAGRGGRPADPARSRAAGGGRQGHLPATYRRRDPRRARGPPRHARRRLRGQRTARARRPHPRAGRPLPTRNAPTVGRWPNRTRARSASRRLRGRVTPWRPHPRGASVSEHNKATVRRLITEVLNGGRLEAIDELYAPELAPAARRWIAPFRASFPDVHMEVVELIAEGDHVVGRFTCSATHLGEWLGHPPTGRRFERVDEVSIFRMRDVRISQGWSLEDTLGRLRQLGLA